MNLHFLLGFVGCVVCIAVPSVIFGRHYDTGINHWRQANALLLQYAPAYASMTSAEVDAALNPIVSIVDAMLTSLSTFPHYFHIAWVCWLAVIIYSYGVESAYSAP